MKFIAVLAGVSLLAIGLLAYSLIPNIHTTSIQSTVPITGPTQVVVGPNFQSETHQSVTLVSGKSNEMLVNLTVSTASGEPSSIQFKLFTEPQFSNCMKETNPSGCLVLQNVSDQTILVPLNKTTTYYFDFNNQDPNNSRIVLLSASLEASAVNTIIGRDGESNYAALALGFVGLVVALYGVVAKTVIPWE